ncbi:MAG TPA: cytochrome c [Candidatus Sulfotelmatobacter sp.]
MRRLILRFIPAGLVCLAFIPATQAQSDAAKIFKSNCVLCHSADGSGDSSTGKALKAKDLRSADVQGQSDAALAEAITKGKGKMPAFGKKLKPDDVSGLVTYVRGLKK